MLGIWFPFAHMGFCEICSLHEHHSLKGLAAKGGLCLLVVCSEHQRIHLSDYCTIKIPSWGFREKVPSELQACLPLTLPLNSDSSFHFSLNWQQALRRGWLPPSPFSLMNSFQPWKTSPLGEMTSKSMELYFHAQPSLEYRSSSVHLMKLNLSLKFISKKKLLEEKLQEHHLFRNPLHSVDFI